MKKKEEKIAVVIYNYIQYLSIMPGIRGLIKEGYDIDFYCGELNDNSGFNDLFSDVLKILKKDGLKVYRKPKNTHYKIVLEPYHGDFTKNAKYYIRYRYGPLCTVKPNKVIYTEPMLHFDCILCSGPYEAGIVDGFAHTEQVADLKYINFKKKNRHRKDGKKVLLYLPTYDEESSIDLIANELGKLKKDYYIITKFHHGTSFLKRENDRLDKIKNVVDEWYDLHTELKDLLEISDVVLSDNSGAIFEAMINYIPVAIFSKDLNQNRIGDFNTTQYELNQKGIMPYTNDTKKIKKILKEALSEKIIEKQKRWTKESFTFSKDPVKDFVNIIDNYYNDNINMRDYLIRRSIKQIINDKEQLIARCEKQEKRLNEYKSGKLYKLSTKIYVTKSRIKRNIKKIFHKCEK